MFYFDFNGANYQETGTLEKVLINHLHRWEEKYQVTDKSETLSGRFQNILTAAMKVTGLRCVVLVDEYDKPLLDLMENSKLQEHNKAVFKGFFSILKNCDEYLQFVFITGVTKFHKVSIFSDLNQLVDISLIKEFSGICGITEQELKQNFLSEIKLLAEEKELSTEKCLEQLKKLYDGYHFHQKGIGVYNPYSFLNSLFAKEFGSYWFGTGTPAFLVKALRNSLFDVRRLTDKTIYASESILQDYTGDTLIPIPLLYQTGYLTIADYDSAAQEYTLTFPNEEVKYGFLESLITEYIPDCGSGSGIDIFTLRRYIEHGELESVRNVLTALFARITYTASDTLFEHYFQAVIYLVFTLLGKFALCEMHTFTGRIDCKVETKKFIYLFEFKRDESADKALQQIEDKSYALPFVADGRKIYKIGVSFDSGQRILADWKVKEE